MTEDTTTNMERLAEKVNEIVNERRTAQTFEGTLEAGFAALREAGLSDPETITLAQQRNPHAHPGAYVLMGLELGRHEAFVASVERDIEGLS